MDDKTIYVNLKKCLSKHFEMYGECKESYSATLFFLKKLNATDEQITKILEFVKEHGGDCDCKVWLNCPPEMR